MVMTYDDQFLHGGIIKTGMRELLTNRTSLIALTLLGYCQAIFHLLSLHHGVSLQIQDCIRFAKIRNDSSDPSDSTMKKTQRVRHAFHSRKSEEYTFDLDRSYTWCFFHSRVTP